MWAAIAALVAILLMAIGQWLLALVVAVLGGAGYVLAKSIEDVIAERERAGIGN